MIPVRKLAGRRILIVEDEMLIAVSIEDTLLDFGCVVGPAAKLEVALQLPKDEKLDGAILDVSIRGGHVYPVAEKLLTRSSIHPRRGYGQWALPTAFQDRPTLTKPFKPQELEEHLMQHCGAP